MLFVEPKRLFAVAAEVQERIESHVMTVSLTAPPHRMRVLLKSGTDRATEFESTFVKATVAGPATPCAQGRNCAGQLECYSKLEPTSMRVSGQSVDFPSRGRRQCPPLLPVKLGGCNAGSVPDPLIQGPRSRDERHLPNVLCFDCWMRGPRAMQEGGMCSTHRAIRVLPCIAAALVLASCDGEPAPTSPSSVTPVAPPGTPGPSFPTLTMTLTGTVADPEGRPVADATVKASPFIP